MSEHAAARSDDVREGEILTASVGDTKVLLTRVHGNVRACATKCPQLNLSLSKGKVELGAIVCPFHGSSYDLATGENKDWVKSLAGRPLPKWTRSVIALGKKPQPLTVYTATERDGTVYVELD